MTAPNTHGWMTLKDAAAYLERDQRTVARGVHEGKLPGIVVGGTYFFRKAWLDRWLDGAWIDHLASGVPTSVEVELPPYLRAV